jgi:hypothetical protein
MDKNHCVASIGGAGHDGSFGRVQHCIAVDPNTGELLRLAEIGMVPTRRHRVVA